MTAPRRIQLRRTKGWRKPPGTIVVARPSRWGNPFTVGSTGLSFCGESNGSPGHYGGRVLWNDLNLDRGLTATDAVVLYRLCIEGDLDDGDPDSDDLRDAVESLRGHDLACWCPLEDDRGQRVPCHADVLLVLANPDVRFPWT